MFGLVLFLLFIAYMAGLICGLIFAQKIWETDIN